MSDHQDQQSEPFREEASASASSRAQVIDYLSRAMALLDATAGPLVIRARLADLIDDLRGEQDLGA